MDKLNSDLSEVKERYQFPLGTKRRGEKATFGCRAAGIFLTGQTECPHEPLHR